MSFSNICNPRINGRYGLFVRSMNLYKRLALPASDSGTLDTYAGNDGFLHVVDEFGTDTTLGLGATPSFPDNIFRVQDSADLSKQFALEVANVTTATTRTFVVPDAEGILPAIPASGSLGVGSATYGSGTFNTILGIAAGVNISGNCNTILGAGSGTTDMKDNNILIGADLDVPNVARTNTLTIGDNYSGVDADGSTSLDPSYVRNQKSASGNILYYDEVTGEISHDVDGGPSVFPDNIFRVQDSADLSKQFALEVANVTTATTRTFIVPDSDGIFTATPAFGSLGVGSATYGSGTSNTVVGLTSGAVISSGSGCVVLGSASGTTDMKDNNILIGSNVDLPNVNRANTLTIGANYSGVNVDGSTSLDPTYLRNQKSSSGNILYYDAVTGEISQDVNDGAALATPRDLSTGIFLGGLVTQVNSTDYQYTAGAGQVVNQLTGTVTQVSWITTIRTLSTIGGGPFSAVGLDINGNIVEQNAPFNELQLKSIISLADFGHQSGSLEGFNPTTGLAYTPMQHIRTLFDVLGIINPSGNDVSGNGGTLTCVVTSGNLFRNSINYSAVQLQTPTLEDTGEHIKQFPATDPMTFSYVSPSNIFADPTFSTTAIDPDLFDLPLTSITNNFYTTQRIWMFGNGFRAISPGQFEYKSADEARNAISSELFTPPPAVAINGIIIAFMIIQEGETDIVNAVFIDGPKFQGTTLGGGGGSGGSGDVFGPATSTVDALVRWDNTIGTTVANSSVTLSDTGLMSGLLDPVSAQDAATMNYVDARFPASSTDNAIARFDSTTGLLLQNSTVIVGDTGLISGVLDPVSAQDAVTKNYVDLRSYDGPALWAAAIPTRTAIIGHRFSKNTQQIYDMDQVRRQITRGLRFVEIDVSRTNDGLFYISHGNAEEYLNPPSPVTASDYQNQNISLNGHAKSGQPLPSLAQVIRAFQDLPAILMVEDKSGDHDDLITALQGLGATPEMIIFQDFDIAATEAFENAGYTTMLLTSAVPAAPDFGVKFTYLGTNFTGAGPALFDASGLVSEYFAYTFNSPAEWVDFKAAHAKCAGCFSDCALPMINPNQLNSDNGGLQFIDPLNGYVSSVSDNKLISPYSSMYITDSGNFRCVFNSPISADASINIHNYIHDSTTQAIFAIESWGVDEVGGTDWWALVLRIGRDYLETDEATTREQAITFLFRNDGDVDIFKLFGGSATSISSGSPGDNVFVDRSRYYVGIETLDNPGVDRTFNVRISDSMKAIFDKTAIIVASPVLLVSGQPSELFGTEYFITILRDDTQVGVVEYIVPGEINSNFLDPLRDDDFNLRDSADNSKRLNFSMGSISTGTTRTITCRDSNYILPMFNPGSSTLSIALTDVAPAWTGADNVAFGYNALDAGTSVADCVAIGSGALTDAVTNSECVAVGSNCLANCTIDDVTSVGFEANFSLTIGVRCTSMGWRSQRANIDGANNTTYGYKSGDSITSGDDNVCLGALNGDSITTGDGNVLIGTDVNVGTGTDSNCIGIGRTLTLSDGEIVIGDASNSSCVIRGIHGETITSSSTVIINSSGLLGTIVSSRRYKNNISDLVGSERLYDLRPRNFSYTIDRDPDETITWGLIAEECEEIFPEIVIKNDNGQPETVQYFLLPVLLLDCMQKLKSEFDHYRKDSEERITRLGIKFGNQNRTNESLINDLSQRLSVLENHEDNVAAQAELLAQQAILIKDLSDRMLHMEDAASGCPVNSNSLEETVIKTTEAELDIGPVHLVRKVDRELRKHRRTSGFADRRAKKK